MISKFRIKELVFGQGFWPKSSKEGASTYTSMLFVAGIALILSGSSSIQTGWPFCWFGMGFVLVGFAYAQYGAGIFGKRLDGGRFWLNRLILCPFLWLNYAMWYLRHRLLSREDICNEVAPGIWLGRRPLDGELPASVTTVVDLTAEFSATNQARKLNYLCVPTLDGCAPDFEEFRQLMSNLSSSCEPVYLHCAAGHGRSATVAVALLVARGLAKDLNEAERIVKSRRPLVSIKNPQRELLRKWFEARNQANAGATETLSQHKQQHIRTFVDMMKRALVAVGRLFFLISVVLVGAILAIAIPFKFYSDYQKNPESTIFGLAASLGMAFLSYWVTSRHGD